MRSLGLDALVLDHALHRVHVNLELGGLADHPGHEAREVERRGERQAGEAALGGKHHGDQQRGAERDGDAHELQAHAEPAVHHLDGPPALVGRVQQLLVLVEKHVLPVERAHRGQTGQSLAKVAKDGAGGDAVEPFEFAAGGDEDLLEPPVDDGQRDDAQDEGGRHERHDGQGHPHVDEAHGEGADAAGERHIHGLCVLGEAVQQAAGGLRVEEGHWEADDLGQQAAVERARRVVGAEHDEDAAHEGKHQGPAAQRKVDRHVVPVVGLGAGAAGGVGPHREPEVLANLHAALNVLGEEVEDGQDEQRAPRGEIRHVDCPADLPLGAPLHLDQPPARLVLAPIRGAAALSLVGDQRLLLLGGALACAAFLLIRITSIHR
mmetsp:Transcript_6916/g.17692  ORF Transcript_6916/g.17692 Transcript_6916/m.17692 type:complete len:378 (+) Transcript_6916:890-2023(+)